MDFARRFVNADNEWSNRSLAQLSLQYGYSDLFAATDGFHEKNKIGTGSYGAVYKGIMGDGTEVAIKVIDLPSEAGFEDEVRVLSKFRHPNLVILMGFAVNGSQRLLVYECLSGGDVSRRLQKCARENLPFTFQQRISVALDAACGLSHLHNASPKVYHRDIKAANILLDRNGGAKMADFGLACLSRSTEHKVKQASGTIGYACPYYIQRGVVTEGSEVYSFGMVLIELLCNAPPACSGPTPGEILYLVNHLQGSVARCVAMADPKAGFPSALANRLAELAMNCVSMTETQRPKFVQIVKALRAMNETALIAPVRQPPLSPTPASKKTAPLVDLIKFDFEGGDSWCILHSCTLEDSMSGSLPSFKIGRHCQTAVFDALVPTDALKGTISREHLTVSFVPVSRSANLQFHASVVNNSINSIAVNGKVLEKGQSSYLYSGDTLAFLALQPGATIPTPFLTFAVSILQTHLICAAAAANENTAPDSPNLSVGRNASAVSTVAESEIKLDHLVAHSAVVSHRVVVPQPIVAQSAAVSQPVVAQPAVVSQRLVAQSAVVPQSDFYLCTNDTPIYPSTSGVIRVGRSFQPEAFWRSLAADACPGISRDHFAIWKDSSSVVQIVCNSMNGLVLDSVLLPKGAVARPKEGSVIELANGAVRFTLMASVSGALKPPVPTSTLVRLQRSFEEEEAFPNDAFSLTGFRSL